MHGAHVLINDPWESLAHFTPVGRSLPRPSRAPRGPTGICQHGCQRFLQVTRTKRSPAWSKVPKTDTEQRTPRPLSVQSQPRRVLERHRTGRAGAEWPGPPLLRRLGFSFLWVDSRSDHTAGTHSRPGTRGARLPATSQERAQDGSDTLGRCGTPWDSIQCERRPCTQGPSREADRQVTHVHTHTYVKQGVLPGVG